MATDGNGLANTSSAVSITVNPPPVPPTVALTSPSSGASYPNAANIALTATASSPAATISKVEFYSGTTLIGTSTTNPYAFTWNSVAGGNYSLTAKATDGNGLSTASAAVAISVANTFAITSGATAFPNPAGVGQMIDMSVSASGAPGDTLTYNWNMGDGTQASGISMNHAFLVAGTYNVSVVVGNGHGGQYHQ